jgi:hypothetical protein
MLLSPQEAELFFKLHRALMCYVNRRLQVVPDIETPNQFSALPPETRLQVRSAFLEETDLIESFVDANPFDFSEDELDVVASWQHQVAGKFFIFRYLKRCAVFLATEEPATAYGVLALTDPLEDLAGPYLPVWVETFLLPFNDKIVYDGLLSRYNISFGPGIRRSLNEQYKEAKERLGIVTSLPVRPSAPALKKTMRSSTKPSNQATSRAKREISSKRDQG